MKGICLILLILPYLLIGQSNQHVDTVETAQLEEKGGLWYKLGSDKPFTGILIAKYRNGVLRAANNYVNGVNESYTAWDFVDNLKIEQNYTLNGNTWDQVSQTNYNSDGQKLAYFDYKNDIERYWYEDGSLKEENGKIDNEPYRKIWDHNGDQIIIGSTIPKDSVDIKEIEWPGLSPRKKGDTKPFTGVITLSGEFDYNKFIFRESDHFSTVNFVFGRLNGPYTTWYQKDGQKKSEIYLTDNENGYVGRIGIMLDGPFTEWYENGQLKTKGAYYLGDPHNIQTLWYENGQIKSKTKFNRGEPDGVVSRWYQNGQKEMEMTYLENEVIKISEWDENGNTIREWPESDKDKNGLKVFLNQFMSVLKSKDYDQIQDLYINKEAMLNLMQKMEVPSTDKFYKKINENWSEFADYYKKRFDYAKAFEDEFFYEQYLKNGTIKSYVYDYQLEVNNEESLKVEWPESINFDLTNADFVNAKIKLSIGSDEQQYTMRIPLLYIDNAWYFNPFGE